MNSYKQKKLEEWDKWIESDDFYKLAIEGNENPQHIFISSLIDETEKEKDKEFEKERILLRKHEIKDLEKCRQQAQSDMREDLVSWIHNSEMDGVEINNLIDYLNKIK